MIYIYGDSHAGISFKGLPLSHYNFHSPSVTMFRIGRDNIIVNFDTNTTLRNYDVIILCYGEVDCRCHIQRQINNGRDEDAVIEELVNAYFMTIYNNVTGCVPDPTHIIIVGVIPPTKRDNYERIHGPITHEYPFVGTDQERVRYTGKVNARMAEYAQQYGYTWCNPYAYYTREDGTLKYEYSDRTVHLGNNAHFLKEFYATLNTIFGAN